MYGLHDGRHGGPREDGRRHGGGRFGAGETDWSMVPGGRGRRRLFDGGELRLVLLGLIAEAPRHGYDLIREIEARTGGAYAPSPGVVYPTLTMLADMDLIAEQAADGAKKVFASTAAGAALLAERAEEVAALMERLAALGTMRSRERGSPVRRAIGNLRQVIHDRLGEAEVPADTLHAVAAILDEAAQRIERL